MGNFNAVTIMMSCLTLVVIVIIIFLKYKKLQDKPKLWKVFLVLLFGMFAISYNWNFQDVVVRLPILPLGVWILLFVFRNKKERWLVYRPFAWLGFFSLFLFILTTLLTIPINKVFYPKDELSTYIANVDDASIIATHPSAESRSLNKENLANEISEMEQEEIYSDQWYGEMTRNIDTAAIDERFPYQLTGSSAKFGSGVVRVIYVEKDGRGLLITTPKGQYYFRSDDSLFRGGNQ
ncbi:hypothetical protein [Radiobacillus sp. PE A8.2]|uniref:hypothetical protein n=1 Tax=Radiobacillus sp. PE A8.2 TaxID=3380349 RepID=UPI00388D221C